MRYKYVPANQAEKMVSASGESTTFLATGADTDGRVSIFDSRLKQGGGAPWHYHDTDDEIFYIVSGEVEFGIDQQVIVAQAGDLVIAGPKAPRRFTALQDSHMVVVNTPSGPAEGFLREISALQSAPTEAEKQHFIEQYGIHVL
ncbi:MAG: cupin domain-containing protein [Formosimonas sp.]